jgi:hypothetical protein
VGGAVVAHAAVSALARARNQTGIDVPKEGDK